MWAARFVHRFNHAGFQQRARRGEGDFVRGFVFRAVVPPFFRTVSFVFMSHLAALDGEIGEWMAGAFLALAQVGKQTMNIVTALGGEFAFDAPDFL